MKVYIVNRIAKSYILNIKIRPPVTDNALRIKLLMRTSVTRGLILIFKTTISYAIFIFIQEICWYIKGIIRRHKSTNRQFNGQWRKDKQKIIQKN